MHHPDDPIRPSRAPISARFPDSRPKKFRRLRRYRRRTPTRELVATVTAVVILALIAISTIIYLIRS